MKNMTLAAVLTTMLAASAGALAMPGAGGPRHGHRVPSAEALATVPGLDAVQRDQLRTILRERRDALESARDQARAAHEAQRRKDRAEFERIDEQSDARIRKLLGEDGFRRYAEWAASQRTRGPHAGPAHRRGHGAHGAPGPRRDEVAPPSPSPSQS